MLRASILMLLGALGVVLAAQQPTPFKGGTRTVAVYATVTEHSGRLVPDLTRDDFEVADNGKRQEITVFANDIQPITVVMMLDRSGSMQSNFRLVANAAEQFVTDLLPADKARIGSFSNRIQVDPRDFTSDHNELISILRTELQEAGPTPLWNAVNVGITALLHQQGRRVILVFTDGVDFPMNSTSSSLKEVMTRAEEEDVMVYAIGLAGRSFGGGRRGGGGFGRGGRGGRGGGYGGGYGGRRPTQEKPDEGLPKIAAATGGGYFELTSTADLTTTFARVADELHHQYVLGFTPVALDGKMHKLEVRVKRPEMSSRARKSYLASTER
jgi:Ca-activated chloride channel family protein